MPVEHNTTCALIEIVCQYLSRITFCTDNSTGRPSFLSNQHHHPHPDPTSCSAVG